MYLEHLFVAKRQAFVSLKKSTLKMLSCNPSLMHVGYYLIKHDLDTLLLYSN